MFFRACTENEMYMYVCVHAYMPVADGRCSMGTHVSIMWCITFTTGSIDFLHCGPVTVAWGPLRLASEEKFLLDRVMRVEKHFASLAMDMGLLIRKVAKTRNRSDAMAQNLQSHADSEEGSMKQSLSAIAECFAALEDYRQVLVDRLEAKVHRPLLNFDGVCRKAKVKREGLFDYLSYMGLFCDFVIAYHAFVYI